MPSKITQINEEIQQSMHSSIEERESKQLIMDLLKTNEDYNGQTQEDEKQPIAKIQTPKRAAVFTKVVHSPPKIKDNGIEYFRKINKVPLKLLK